MSDKPNLADARRVTEGRHWRSVRLGIVVIVLWLTWGAWFAHHLGWWGAYIFGVIAGANVSLVVRDLRDERHRLAESAPAPRGGCSHGRSFRAPMIRAWWWIVRHPFKGAAIRRYLHSAGR